MALARLLLLMLLQLLLASNASLIRALSSLARSVCSGYSKQWVDWTRVVGPPLWSTSSRRVASCESWQSHGVGSVACWDVVGGTTRGWKVILHHDLHCLCNEWKGWSVSLDRLGFPPNGPHGNRDWHASTGRGKYCLERQRQHWWRNTLIREEESYLWTTLVMKSSVHIKASDKPLYNLQNTCLESMTSMTTVKKTKIFWIDRIQECDQQKVKVAVNSKNSKIEMTAHHRLKTHWLDAERRRWSWSRSEGRPQTAAGLHCLTENKQELVKSDVRYLRQSTDQTLPLKRQIPSLTDMRFTQLPIKVL